MRKAEKERMEKIASIPEVQDATMFLRNRSFRAALLKGVDAGLKGEEREACPYEYKMGWFGRPTFSGVFRHQWFRGWEIGNNTRLDYQLKKGNKDGG